MNSTEAEIEAALQLIPARAADEKWSREGQWTIAVKEALVRVGRSLGWMTAANGCDSDEGKEWLYDVVWYQSDRAGHMTEVPLVAESEWGREISIKEDFEKLLLANSKYRVMVFQADSEAAVRELQRKMRIWIEKCRNTQTGSRFLLLGWAMDHWVTESVVT